MWPRGPSEGETYHPTPGHETLYLPLVTGPIPSRLRAAWQCRPFGQRLAILGAVPAAGAVLVAAVTGLPPAVGAALGAGAVLAVVPAAAQRARRRAWRSILERLRPLSDPAARATPVPPPTNPEEAQVAALVARIAAMMDARHAHLETSLEQVQELERLKTEFVSTVSHELRTPLTSMRGALGLVLAGTTGPLPAKAHDLLRIAHGNTERLIRLINDILDIEKIEAGQMALRREWCELGALVQATVRSVETLAQEAGVRLAVEAEGEVRVTADADRLVQVFTNLVANAIKFSPRGEVVTVRVETAGGEALVHVQDRGPGIADEFRSRVFGKFQQQESHDARRKGGTGLGLAIARALVERHEGRLTFDTAVGRGTTFTVALPWTPPTAAPAAGDGYRILLLDDDLGMLSVLSTLCAPLGETFGVRGAEEAIAAAGDARFDAMIVDPAVGDHAGLAAVRRIRRFPGYADLPVLVFSTKEYAATDLEGVTLSSAHAFVKSRDAERDVVMRLKAMLAVRRPRFASAA